MVISYRQHGGLWGRGWEENTAEVVGSMRRNIVRHAIAAEPVSTAKTTGFNAEAAGGGIPTAIVIFANNFKETPAS